MSETLAFCAFLSCSCVPDNRLPCLSIDSLKVIDKRVNNRNTARAELMNGKDQMCLNDATYLGGLINGERYKRQKIDTHNKTIAVLNSRVLTARRNIQVAALASRTETAMTNMKNCFDMARAIEPTPDPSNETWKLCYSAVEECKNLMKLQKNL